MDLAGRLEGYRADDCQAVVRASRTASACWVQAPVYLVEMC